MFRLTPVFMGDFEKKGKGFCSQKLQNPETVPRAGLEPARSQ